MKLILSALTAVATLAVTSGCVVAPGHPAYVSGAATVYVAPSYDSPGSGWVWSRHPGEGWGWYHRDNGWHKGWR